MAKLESSLWIVQQVVHIHVVHKSANIVSHNTENDI